MIPTARERNELKEAYKEAYGEADWEYQKEDYDMMEFRLLNDAYKEKFNNDGFEMPQGDFRYYDLNQELRKRLNEDE